MRYFEIEFSYKGKRDRKVIPAQDREDALTIAKIRLPGNILRAKEVSAPIEEQLKNIKNQFFSPKKKIKIENLIAAIRQLSVMTNAGISIHDSIKEVATATVDKNLKSIFTRMNDDLNSGSSLSESASRFRGELGDVSIAMIELGESTGSMAESLKKLADILSDVMENQKKFKKAIRYPIVVVFAIVIAFVILMTQVIPKFKEIFEQLGGNLPLPTRFLLFIENIMSNYGLVVLAVFILVFVLFKYLYSTNDIFKEQTDTYILKLGFIGDIFFFSTMNRFTLVFTELTRAGLPIVDSLDTALLSVNNINLKNRLRSVRVSVERGVSLTEAFRETGIFEGLLLQMIQAGERSGTVDVMLEKVTEYYKSRFDNIIDNISSYIEPILLAFIAGMVLLMALGIFMPMWDLASAAKGGM